MKYIANPVEVDAFRIEVVVPMEQHMLLSRRSYQIHLEDGSVRTVLPEMTARHIPVVGDYYVIQGDGYVYVNPKDVFERKYRRAEA